ncbi:hypothetical protein Rrhod_1309 [Rhodococcus rhodnii LMG 5362]|uniref:Uncharacterized protein n=1 Tax=Rhodococcus rhodnii LMG 5362 TaxID=1273125 RepID=R7WPW2_9NOCA|nr:hypothetical protein Rrhod_1309 [Rhodococcus rhodnii LMG 5362]
MSRQPTLPNPAVICRFVTVPDVWRPVFGGVGH